MAAMTFLPLPVPSKPVADPSADLDETQHDDPVYCVFSSESTCTELPLTSEPPLPDAEPLTSEPPLAEATPLTSEPPAFVPDQPRP
ncbi:hypothetical protein [Streptomyces sp. NPDC004830]